MPKKLKDQTVGGAQEIAPLEKEKKSIFSSDVSFGRVKPAQKAIFAKHMAVMLRSGLTVEEALDIAQDAARGKMKSVLTKVYKSIQAGNTLSDSFGQYPKTFSKLFVNVTYAGEQSGTLPENMDNLALQMKKQYELVSKVKGSLTYPIFVVSAAILLALSMTYFVLPQITPLFAGLTLELPLTTRMLIWFSEIVNKTGIFFFLTPVVGTVLLVWVMRRKIMRPISHWIILHVPILSRIIKNANLAQFSLTLGTMLRSGLHIDEALDISFQTTNNFYYRRSLKRTCKRIKLGSSVSENLSRYKSLYPKLLVSMVQVGEESGQLDEALIYLAEFFDGEVDESTKSLTTAIEPILLIGIGLIVAVLALGIITPIYELTSGIQGGR